MRYFLLLIFGFFMAGNMDNTPKEEIDQELEDYVIPFWRALHFKGEDRKRYKILGKRYLKILIHNHEASFMSDKNAQILSLDLKCNEVDIKNTMAKDLDANSPDLFLKGDNLQFENGVIKGENAKATFTKSAWWQLIFEGKEFICDDVGFKYAPSKNIVSSLSPESESKYDDPMTLHLTCDQAKIEKFDGMEIILHRGELRLENGSIDYPIVVKSGNLIIKDVIFNNNSKITFEEPGELIVVDKGLSDSFQKNEILNNVVNATVKFVEE
jgi:hypothetical protein